MEPSDRIEFIQKEREEMLKFIESDEETSKAFKVLVGLVERNYPWKTEAEQGLLQKMIDAGCLKDMGLVQYFITRMYFYEKSAGPVFKPVRGFGGVRG